MDAQAGVTEAVQEIATERGGARMGTGGLRVGHLNRSGITRGLLEKVTLNLNMKEEGGAWVSTQRQETLSSLQTATSAKTGLRLKGGLGLSVTSSRHSGEKGFSTEGVCLGVLTSNPGRSRSV